MNHLLELVRPTSLFERFDRADLLLPAFLAPCRLKILMLVDGYPGQFLNGSFNNSYFGLSAVLDTFANNPEYFVKFDITRAHRQTDTFKPDPSDTEAYERYAPHHENFRFTQGGFNLDDYDQVWLFGVRANVNDAQRLTDAELDVLARWMNRGGGLFATGDHDDLGASMCARVPRARTMRRWQQGNPSPVGANRHDTLLKGHNDIYTFDDESDDIPMRVTPKYYNLASWPFWVQHRAPHPLLCGSDGVIDILPDHPHEGEVVPDAEINLNANFTAGTYANQPEYPSHNGTRPAPEIIAWARVQADHTNASDLNKGLANARTFGAIGAYDGHLAEVGRVVVDSTWHHWFDVNLVGRPVSSLNSAPFNNTNPKTQGFLATVAGQQALSRIQNYFRNVAIWLASPARQRCMFLRASWGMVVRYPLVEQLRPNMAVWILGDVARDALGRRASQCMVTRWILDLFPPLMVDRLIRFKDPLPCLSCPPIDVLETFALGGMVREMLPLAYALDGQKEPRLDEREVAKAMIQGVRSGLEEFVSLNQKGSKEAARFQEELTQAIKGLPGETAFVSTTDKPTPRPRRSTGKSAGKSSKGKKK